MSSVEAPTVGLVFETVHSHTEALFNELDVIRREINGDTSGEINLGTTGLWLTVETEELIEKSGREITKEAVGVGNSLDPPFVVVRRQWDTWYSRATSDEEKEGHPHSVEVLGRDGLVTHGFKEQKGRKGLIVCTVGESAVRLGSVTVGESELEAEESVLSLPDSEQARVSFISQGIMDRLGLIEKIRDGGAPAIEAFGELEIPVPPGFGKRTRAAL
jgi:hypothetical protein